MKLDDNFEESNSSIHVVAIVVSIIAITVILFILLFANRGALSKGNKNDNQTVSNNQVSISVNSIPSDSGQSGIHVSDLDFYDMYASTDSESSSETSTGVSLEEEELTEENDGKHTKIIDYDGTTDWVSISPYLAKNDFDFSNLVNQAGKYKYFEEDKCISSFGVDISKDQGYVDFNKLKKAGADFVMIRVGQRGYQSGALSEDEYFKDSLKRATDAGLMVGVYFLSQAINETEAKEEADYVLERIKDYNVVFPVAFVMKYAEKDTSRVETVSRNDKSMIARAFLKKIKAEGYKPMLYGDKTWLIRYVDLSKLINDYDIWLSEPDEVIPDYPYKFAMWQYNKSGTIDGISGTVDFNISFIDYSLK